MAPPTTLAKGPEARSVAGRMSLQFIPQEEVRPVPAHAEKPAANWRVGKELGPLDESEAFAAR